MTKMTATKKMMEERAKARPATPLEQVTDAMASLSWVRAYEDLILDYCRVRTPTGETLWAKIREWSSEALHSFEAPREEPQAVAWDALCPAERAALDLLAIQSCGLAAVIGRHFPAPAPASVVVPVRAPKVEDTIFERATFLGERDPDRVAAVEAVAAIMAKAGLTLGEVEGAIGVDGDAIDDDDDGDLEEDEAEDENGSAPAKDADDETLDKPEGE